MKVDTTSPKPKPIKIDLPKPADSEPGLSRKAEPAGEQPTDELLDLIRWAGDGGQNVD